MNAYRAFSCPPTRLPRRKERQPTAGLPNSPIDFIAGFHSTSISEAGSTASTVDSYRNPEIVPNMGMLTPACSDCNSRLSNLLCSSLAARCDLIREKIIRKFAKVVRSAHWAPDELQTLKHGLRGFVRRNQELKRLVQARIAWQRSEGFFELFDQAWVEVRREYPYNRHLLDFMRPPWISEPSPESPPS